MTCVGRQFFIIILLAAYHCVTASGELSDTEYARMPPVYHMDSYEPCLQRRGDMYCMVHFTLLSDGPSELLDMIHAYSEDTAAHLNHSNLRYGLCLAESCGDYTRHATVSAEQIEACLNTSFGEKYNLQTRVTKFNCNEYNEVVERNFGDFCMGLIVFVIACLTISGTLLDIFQINLQLKDYPIFLNFSVRYNWRRLTAPYDTLTDPKRKIFKSLHGVRVVLVCLVILGHSRLPHSIAMKNSRLIEESYKDILQYVFLNGNVIVQAYFVLSGMLLVYKLQIYSESNKIDYHLIPRAIANRWLRLVPPQAFVMLLIGTWLRLAKSGPLWETAVAHEIRDCQQRGWLSLLYLNNFLLDSQCLPHTWYIAADMQLYYLGLLLFLIAKNKNNRNFLLGSAFLIGLLIPAVITYVRNLNPLIIVSLPNVERFFGTDPTFNEVYKQGYTNIPSYVTGLALGYLIYDLQRCDFQIEKYKKYRYVYWAAMPACLIPMLVGSIFYHGPPQDPIHIRMLYVIFAKPFFGLLVAILIFGFVFKYENIYRRFFEWDGWLAPSRLSYCAFLVHFLTMRLYTGTRTELIEIHAHTNVIFVIGFIASSYLVALLLWLLVEAPFAGLIEFYSAKQSFVIKKSSMDFENNLKTE